MIETLSRREKEVYDLLIEGKSYKEIASVKNKSWRTVGKQCSSIYKKFNVRTFKEFYSKFGPSKETVEIKEIIISIPELKYHTIQHFALSDIEVRYINNILKWQKENAINS